MNPDHLPFNDKLKLEVRLVQLALQGLQFTNNLRLPGISNFFERRSHGEGLNKRFV